MRAPTAPRLIVLSFALMWLTGCGLRSTRTVTRPQVIEVPVVSYVPVPHGWTVPLVEPPPPPRHCTYLGKPAVCITDAVSWIEKMRGVLRKANVDRACTARLANKGDTCD